MPAAVARSAVETNSDQRPATAVPPAKAEAKPAEPERPKAFKPETALPDGSSAGYRVQLGLFTNTANAEKMVAKLKEAGVEAHTETRVHLGPFKTRAEADEASTKLKALGFTPLLVPLSK